MLFPDKSITYKNKEVTNNIGRILVMLFAGLAIVVVICFFMIVIFLLPVLIPADWLLKRFGRKGFIMVK